MQTKTYICDSFFFCKVLHSKPRPLICLNRAAHPASLFTASRRAPLLEGPLSLRCEQGVQRHCTSCLCLLRVLSWEAARSQTCPHAGALGFILISDQASLQLQWISKILLYHLSFSSSLTLLPAQGMFVSTQKSYVEALPSNAIELGGGALGATRLR